METGSFDALTPDAAAFGVESAYGLRLDGTLIPYPSYINRVYGLRDEEEREYVVKFYRPGRWPAEAIRDEHAFLSDCAEADLPVACPVKDPEGETLEELVLEEEGEPRYLFALFPKMGGRNFDPESDEQWLRLGALAGRMHRAARQRDAQHRAMCHPDLTAGFVKELIDEEVVHPELAGQFEELCAETLERIRPLFSGLVLQRLHGDLHRGNILDRPGTGLLLFDFDDMMMGPAVQDLWLLLPGLRKDSGRELSILLEGYEQFADFDRSMLSLIEPLRFMRMVYFLAWRARQREDYWFQSSFPDWGSKPFWIKEIEDLHDQARVIGDGDV